MDFSDAELGQLLCCGWQDDEHAERLLTELHVGGLILFARNLGPLPNLARQLQEWQTQAATPLFLAVDQEGGAVSRFADPGLAFPGQMALGALGCPETARRVARAIGVQLRALGFNVDFAPVLDVNNNPANPVIGLRSFGDDPEQVAALGVATAAGLREAGVLPVGKHFPGHGDTAVDSHFDLPVQPAGRERLDGVELVPFRAAIATGIPALMTAHLLFPALDPTWPATLSPPILTGLLREELGFDGLLFTDCLEMAGVAAHWPPEERGWRALAAGADVLLVSHTWETQQRVLAGVREAIADGRVRRSRVRAALARIAAAKAHLATTPAPPIERLSAAEFRDLEAEVAARAITVVAGRDRLPLRPQAPVLCCAAEAIAHELAAQLAALGWPARPLPWPETAPPPIAAGEAPLICFVATRDRRPWRAVLPTLAAGRRVVAAVADPYALPTVQAAPVRIVTYGGARCHLAALASVLAGLRRAEGRLPVRVPGLAD